MRHGNKVKKIGRTREHRIATMAALSTALITHKRITTTLAKAKALRGFVEPVINRSKDDTTHNRREVFRRLRDKHAVTELFGEIAEKVGSRPGGYTRIVKLGQRAGDATEMAIIEIVDYNDDKPDGKTAGGRKRRTRRSGGGAKGSADTTASTPKATDKPKHSKKEDAPDSDDSPEKEEVVIPEAEAPNPQGAAEEEAPDSSGKPLVPQGPSGGSTPGMDHGDSEQGAAPGTGNPVPESHATNINRSGHRG
jgi:large subunit ribosomal protein L17